MNLQLIIITTLIILSIIDLSLTFYYVDKYKKWQPNKPYDLIERNPLLVFLWNNFGLYLGMFIGAVIILSLIYLVGKTAHWAVILLLFLVFGYTLYNHYVNINLLHQLIEKYPTGHLSEQIFGKVVGNN